ncbi:MAG: hypothetical protein HYZ73_07675 [Elusimicrobia bacterium]|nr:hypothetical protein [Elusimicrobiota bacterium]
MSDQDVGRKMHEKHQLEFFLDAYEFVVGERLGCAGRESPDFICERPGGLLVGLELTCVMRDPERAFWDATLDKQYYRRPEELSDALYESASRKSEKMRNGTWAHSDNTILVLQLMDCPLTKAATFLEQVPREDFASFGMKEIWVADYTMVESYSAVDLFGFYPSVWFGFHPGPRPHGEKPYG